MQSEKILELKELHISFTQYTRGLQRRTIENVCGLSFSTYAGEVTALVGASGSGKSLLAHAVMGLLPYNASMDGEIFYRERLLEKEQIEQLRGSEILLVPQGASYLDPLMKSGAQILKGSLSLIHIFPRTVEKKKKQAMTKEQQKLFMEYAKESYLYNFFAVLLRTGMRSGELRGLIYALDVDKKNRVIHIQRTLKYENVETHKIPKEKIIKTECQDKGGAVFFTDTPKTASSRRDIPMTNEIEKYLDAQKNYWGFKIERMDRFLFCTEEGKPLSRERVQAEINRIVRNIRSDGYEFPRITSHMFRHTFATRAIEEGMKPQVLKTILGHSSLAMTMDLYSHVLPDVKAEEMDKIAGGF